MSLVVSMDEIHFDAESLLQDVLSVEIKWDDGFVAVVSVRCNMFYNCGEYLREMNGKRGFEAALENFVGNAVGRLRLRDMDVRKVPGQYLIRDFLAVFDLDWMDVVLPRSHPWCV